MTSLFLLAALSVSQGQAPQPSAPPKAANEPAPASAPQAPPARDIESDTPPPSTYDLQQRHSEPSPPEEGRTLASQLVRTVLALLFVVGLIYAVAKLGLARLARVKGIGTGRLRLLERLPVDARNSLFLVELDGTQRFLLGGGGDKGLNLVAALQNHKSESDDGDKFAAALAKAGTKDSETRAELPSQEGADENN